MTTLQGELKMLHARRQMDRATNGILPGTRHRCQDVGAAKKHLQTQESENHGLLVIDEGGIGKDVQVKASIAHLLSDTCQQIVVVEDTATHEKRGRAR